MVKFRWITIIVGLVVIFSGCKKDNQFAISGKITNAGDKTIYLEQLFVSNSTPIDSVKINSKGEFKFKHQTSIPTFYLLKLSDINFVTLLVDSAENVNISADVINFSSGYLVEGSPGSEMVQQLNEKLHTTKQKLDSIRSLNILYENRNNYAQLKEGLDTEYAKIVQTQVDYSTNFVLNNPFSMASVLALYQRFDPETYVITDIQPLKVAASALHSIYPGSDHVQALYANTLQLMQNERAAKLQQIIENEGSNSPDIVLPDPEGKDIPLSSLRGKYVLLHFWSAKDEASRIVNPVLKELYRKYKSKGFEIYQVSVDKERFEWIDAIDKDQLTWVNVGDMEGSINAVNVYNIKQIPSNYLLDKEGVIIAKNLKGPSLTKKLANIFD